MFFNRVKNVAKRGFELGREAIRKAPIFISKALDTANRINSTAKQIADKSSQARDVYQTSKKFLNVSGDIDSKINRGFDTISSGVKRIDEANNALQNVGGAVRTLF